LPRRLHCRTARRSAARPQSNSAAALATKMNNSKGAKALMAELFALI
jgi:hypothetical protein